MTSNRWPPGLKSQSSAIRALVDQTPPVRLHSLYCLIRNATFMHGYSSFHCDPDCGHCAGTFRLRRVGYSGDCRAAEPGFHFIVPTVSSNFSGNESAIYGCNGIVYRGMRKSRNRPGLGPCRLAHHGIHGERRRRKQRPERPRYDRGACSNAGGKTLASRGVTDRRHCLSRRSPNHRTRDVLRVAIGVCTGPGR